MKTEEERIKSIVDELQSGPFQKYDVHIRITLKEKNAPTEGKKAEQQI